MRARLICLSGVDDAKIEVREEALKGILLERSAEPSRTAESLISSIQEELRAVKEQQRYPTLEEFLDYLFEDKPFKVRPCCSFTCPIVDKKRQAFESTSTIVKVSVVSFCNRCLVHHCKLNGNMQRSEYLKPSQLKSEGDKDTMRDSKASICL